MRKDPHTTPPSHCNRRNDLEILNVDVSLNRHPIQFWFIWTGNVSVLFTLIIYLMLNHALPRPVAREPRNLVRDSCGEYVKCSPYDDDYIWEALIKLETIQIWREKHDVCLHMRPDRNHHVLRFKIRSERAKKDLHMILNTIFVSLKYSPFLRELLNMVFAV